MIPIKYENKSAILFASGPSLTEEVVEAVRPYNDKFVMFGCNDTYTIVDFLDEHYACDNKWWNHKGAHFREMFPELSSWSQAPVDLLAPYKVTHIKGEHKKGLSTTTDYIHYGSNSGFQVLNLAFLMGIKTFLLVGYNMKMVDNKKHFFGDHIPPLNKTSPYNQFVQAYSGIQSEIKEKIINCTPDSALTMFKYMDLQEALDAYSH